MQLMVQELRRLTLYNLHVPNRSDCSPTYLYIIQSIVHFDQDDHRGAADGAGVEEGDSTVGGAVAGGSHAVSGGDIDITLDLIFSKYYTNYTKHSQRFFLGRAVEMRYSFQIRFNVTKTNSLLSAYYSK